MNARQEHTTAVMIPCVTTPKEDSIARAKLDSQETDTTDKIAWLKTKADRASF